MTFNLSLITIEPNVQKSVLFSSSSPSPQIHIQVLPRSIPLDSIPIKTTTNLVVTPTHPCSIVHATNWWVTKQQGCNETGEQGGWSQQWQLCHLLASSTPSPPCPSICTTTSYSSMGWVQVPIHVYHEFKDINKFILYIKFIVGNDGHDALVMSMLIQIW
jgi:hypothetical protein